MKTTKNAPNPLIVVVALASTAAVVTITLLRYRQQRHQRQKYQQEISMRGLTRGQVLEIRRAHLAGNLSLSFSRTPTGPLCVLSGEGAYLYDHHDNGTCTPILDCVNNVAHVGHSHPRLARVALAQLQAVNTNTRYMHPTRVAYARKLTATFPSPLREEGVVFFVNSGSEANDLALRIARCHAGGSRETIVLGSAYHGHTESLIEISPYKYQGKGGFHPPAYVHQVSAPDMYRGRYRCREKEPRADRANPPPSKAPSAPELPPSPPLCGNISSPPHPAPPVPTVGPSPPPPSSSPSSPPAPSRSEPAREDSTGAANGLSAAAVGQLYANEVGSICQQLIRDKKRLGAFIAESLLGCGGQLVLPPTYLQRCYDFVRTAGGVCIADEVQVGFGRVGWHFWGFESQVRGREGGGRPLACSSRGWWLEGEIVLACLILSIFLFICVLLYSLIYFIIEWYFLLEKN